jgi:phage nucleotide-binding protein
MDLLNIKPNVVSRGVEGKYFLFYGDPSTRKTSVAAMFPGSLLLATEIGYSLIPGVHAVNITNWNEFRNIIRELKRPEVKDKYKTIVIDTVGLLTDMCMKFILDTNGVQELSAIPWGQGWNQFKKEFRTQINTIAQMGYGIVFIAHSDTKRDNESGSITNATPTMDKKPRESVIALVDFIMFLQKEPKDNNPEETTVYAYTKLPSQIESKTRARYLAARFEFNYPNLVAEMSKAIEQYETENVGSVSEAVVNHHVEVATSNMPFEDLRTKVLGIAGELLAESNTNADSRASATAAITTIMKGVRISEATALNYDQLLALLEVLTDIRDGI